MRMNQKRKQFNYNIKFIIGKIFGSDVSKVKGPTLSLEKKMLLGQILWFFF